MQNNSFTENIKKSYIKENLENARLIDYSLLKGTEGYLSVFYDELKESEIDGYPYASDFVTPDGTVYNGKEYESLTDEIKKNCRLRYHYLPYSHELYVGTTGSGKTTGCVEPQLRAISSQKNKPNLFITDPKGELFDRNAQHLKDNGYQTYVLNFKDFLHSDHWNPLLEIYDTQMKICSFSRNVTMRTGKLKEGLTLMGDREKFSTCWIEFDGMAFPDGESFEKYRNFEVDFIEAKVDSLLNQLANMMIEVQSRVDRTWETGAQNLLKGIIQCMLEDATDENSGFTRDMMNFRTIYQYYNALKTPILTQQTDLHNHHLLKNKSEKAKALLAVALGNAERTMMSYCGVFDTSTKDWFQGHIYSLTPDTTISLDNQKDKPFAIFLITRDYEKSDFQIAGLFTDWVYRQMVEKADRDGSDRALHFLLDEFGNIPRIENIENKISTARSRNIWFHLVVQSYAQIDNVYNVTSPLTATIIRDSCNSQIFLGAINYETKEIFSRDCGKHSIPSIDSVLKTDINTIVDVPLIPISSLDLVQPGEMYIKRFGLPIISSRYIRSYICAEHGDFKNFIGANGLNVCTPISEDSFSMDKFTFKELSKEKTYKKINPFIDDIF